MGFVPLAVPDTLDNVELFSRSIKAAARRGCVDQIIEQALNDGVIEKHEAEAYQLLWVRQATMIKRFKKQEHIDAY